MKLAVFDVDGTLVDSQLLIHLGMTAAFEAVGLQPLPKAQVLATVGLSLPVAMARLVPAADEVTHMRLVDAYKDAFTKSRIEETAPLFPGALDCIEALSAHDDLLLAIATGKGKRGLGPMLDAYNLRGRFFSLQTADDHPSKPHPSMLHQAMSEAGIGPEASVMIGDTTFDIEMAVAAGMPAFGVSWGYHPAAALHEAGASRVEDDFSALTAAIEAWAVV